MSDEQGGEGGWALSESKDWKDGRHRRENANVHEHAGEVGNRQTRQTLSVIRAAYERAYRRGWLGEGWPADPSELDLYRLIEQFQATETFAGRVENEPEKLRAHVGSERDDVDVSGWRDIERIREIVTERHLRLYIFGEPGNGKTRSGCLVSRHWLEAQKDAGAVDPVVYTNIRTLAQKVETCEYTPNWPDLKEKIDRTEAQIIDEDTRPFMFLFDEASSQARGTGEQGHEASTKLATLVYKIRKYGGSMCIIGHDGKDLHPAVRELCTVLEKESTKEARFYKSVKNREGREPISPQITGWPDSMWKPNDKDPAPWDWNSPDEGEDGEDGGDISREAAFWDLAVWTVAKVKTRNSDSPPSNEKVASKHLNGLYSGEWVRRRWNEYQDGEHDDLIAEIDEEIA